MLILGHVWGLEAFPSSTNFSPLRDSSLQDSKLWKPKEDRVKESPLFFSNWGQNYWPSNIVAYLKDNPFGIALGAVSLLAMLGGKVLWNRVQQQQRANVAWNSWRQKVLALDQEVLALDKIDEALDHRDEAWRQRVLALNQRVVALNQRAVALNQRAVAWNQKNAAWNQRVETLNQRAETLNQRVETLNRKNAQHNDINDIIWEDQELTQEQQELNREDQELMQERQELDQELKQKQQELDPELTQEQQDLNREDQELTQERQKITQDRQKSFLQHNELTQKFNELSLEHQQLMQKYSVQGRSQSVLFWNDNMVKNWWEAHGKPGAAGQSSANTACSEFCKMEYFATNDFNQKLDKTNEIHYDLLRFLRRKLKNARFVSKFLNARPELRDGSAMDGSIIFGSLKAASIECVNEYKKFLALEKEGKDFFKVTSQKDWLNLRERLSFLFGVEYYNLGHVVKKINSINIMGIRKEVHEKEEKKFLLDKTEDDKDKTERFTRLWKVVEEFESKKHA